MRHDFVAAAFVRSRTPLNRKRKARVPGGCLVISCRCRGSNARSCKCRKNCGDRNSVEFGNHGDVSSGFVRRSLGSVSIRVPLRQPVDHTVPGISQASRSITKSCEEYHVYKDLMWSCDNLRDVSGTSAAKWWCDAAQGNRSWVSSTFPPHNFPRIASHLCNRFGCDMR